MNTTPSGPGWFPTRHDRADLGRQTAGLLRSLGPDSSAVARSLGAAGVAGEPTDARQCALAVYLRAVMQGDHRVATVRVFHDRVVVGTPGRVCRHRVSVALPPPVRVFVAGFDARQFPELVRDREPLRPEHRTPGARTPGGAGPVQSSSAGGTLR